VPYTVRPLDASTWDAFAELVMRNNGVFGGCWCLGYHADGAFQGSPAANQAEKERRVRAGDAHAALVFDDSGAAQGWAQYGSPRELAGIKHRRAYDKDAPPLPDWRITCCFTDKRHRGRGVARAAVEGALSQIADLGGGLVEAISETTDGRAAQGRFLFSATVELFEDNGFARVRQVGKHAWIVSKVVAPPRVGQPRVDVP
jgi:GNAT superfamily N-acetyltransferase